MVVMAMAQLEQSECEQMGILHGVIGGVIGSTNQ